MPRIVVIGAGVVGLSAAHALHQRNWDVTVVEARTAGFGASRVNAGWICPGLTDPVPSPGLVRTSLKWMRRSDSPLYIQPQLSPSMNKWLIDFWRHCNRKDYETGTKALADFNQETLAAYDRMLASGVSFEEYREGLLFAFTTAEAAEEHIQDHLKLTKFGASAPLPVSGTQIHQMEPALDDAIIGGYWLEEERHIRPDTLIDGLVKWLTDRAVPIRQEEAVEAIAVEKDRVTNVVTSDGRIETDAVLVAAGVWSAQIAQLAGRSLPIQPGKGYSLDYFEPVVPFTRPIDLPEFRMAMTPMSDRIRLAGTMEFSGINERIRPERVAAIIRGAKTALRRWPDDQTVPRVSTGLRPMTPDGLPIIGLLKGFRNLAVASGHGMLGVTHAAVTAENISTLLTEGKTPEVIQPFDPARFGLW